MKPIIGLTTFKEIKTTWTYNNVSYNYVNSVLLAGGVPIMIPILKDTEDIDRYLDIVDGLIFTGGEDVAPLLYGENPIKEVTCICSDRDNMELNLFKRAYEKGVPIFGVCRGLQLINVALGGTLYQDINSQIKDSLGHSVDMAGDELYHSMKVEKDSKLYEVFQREMVDINSFHHQSVKDLGKDLKVSAYSEDGIVEAFESTNDKFIMAVQFHPEALIPRHMEFINLFKYFITKCNHTRN